MQLSESTKKQSRRIFLPRQYTTKDNQGIQLNSDIHIRCAILKSVAVSTADAELGALCIPQRPRSENYQVNPLEVRASSTILVDNAVRRDAS